MAHDGTNNTESFVFTHIFKHLLKPITGVSDNESRDESPIGWYFE